MRLLTSLYIFTILILLLPSFSFAAITAVNYTVGTIYSSEQWSIIDVQFPAQENEPFDVEFGAKFDGPGGVTMRVPGFYNGDNLWTLRFSPPQPGDWAFTTYSSSPTLAGKSGAIRATVNKNPNKHGPIVLQKNNPQHFYHADGTPYFVLAFEIDWLFALDAGNSTDIPKTRSIVKTMADHCYNQAVMNVYAHDVSWEKDQNLKPEHEFGSPSVFPFGGSNDKPAHTTLNVEFFQRFDRVMHELDENGIVSHLMIYVWNKLVNWPEAHSKEDNRYFDYVVARYQAFNNLIWDVSKEALGYGHDDMNYISERISRIRKLDAYSRLITVHDYHYCSTHPEKVDFISIQTWSTPLYSQMKDIREKYPKQPILNIEHGGYESSPYVVFPGDYNDPITCLARNYEIIFAGCYSTYYWQGSAWNVIIPDPFHLPKAQQPRFDYYRNIRTLFDKYDFSTLKPVPGRQSSGLCLSDEQNVYIYYLPANNYATHISPPKHVKGSMKITWFNPLTGVFKDGGSEELGNWHEFKSPWLGQIAVLVLEAGKKLKAKKGNRSAHISRDR